jgi:hypothetical protein
VILSYIKNSGMAYDLSADDILYLHSQEISQTVINALLNAKPDQTSPAKSDDDPPPPPVTQSSTPAAVAPAIPTTPPPASAVTISDFKSQLSPFGQWVDVPGYGLGWRPNVQDQELGWRPYFNAGHWEYTRAGWFWKSEYSILAVGCKMRVTAGSGRPVMNGRRRGCAGAIAQTKAIVVGRLCPRGRAFKLASA